MAKDPIKKADNGTYYFRANLGYNPITGKQIQKYRSGFKTKKEAREEYSKALNSSDSNADSTNFIVFMLQTILNTIKEILETEKKITPKINVKITANQKKILEAIKQNPFVTQEELSQIVGIAKLNINKNMKKLQEQGIIE